MDLGHVHGELWLLNDPDSEVFKIITTQRTAVLKPEFGNMPHVFYSSLDHNSEVI
jgi:hypothetical protein